MFIDRLRDEVIFKIVYFGPGLGGKTTNLEYIYSHIDPRLRGNLISLKTKEDRTLYFDFLQVELGRIKGKKPRFHLYTIPGQAYYNFSRKIVLKGADAVVFVADSQKERVEDNLYALEDLEKKLIRQNSSLAAFPWIIQYNKRDLPNIEKVKNLQVQLNFLNVPSFEAIAIYGTGVFETLRGAIRMVISKLS
ncbi:gliding-motility protein MglA [candidate division KSB1 bacterium RBG_16_48_16]|nr:MAG: gliding-motility protein MglA [candidate division KSB1 bacterium RBG_16_48_16]